MQTKNYAHRSKINQPPPRQSLETDLKDPLTEPPAQLRAADLRTLPHHAVLQLQRTIGNRATSRLIASRKPSPVSQPSLQRMFTPRGAAINTLAELNVALAALNPVVANIALADFAAVAGVTAGILDEVIAESTTALYNYMTQQDVIDALTPLLQAATAPPAGYTKEDGSGGATHAYVKNPNGHAISANAMTHIVELRTHLSDQMRGAPAQTPYVHPSDHELYIVTDDGTHRDGLHKVTVGKKGRVRGGVHIFE